MASTTTGKHTDGGVEGIQPSSPEPSFAELARTLAYVVRIGSLSTVSRRQPGFPYGSVMPYVLDDTGRPIFLISAMAMHTKNLQADPRASLLVAEPDTGEDALASSRVTLLGNVQPIPETEQAEVRELYLQHHPNSKSWVDFEDFSFYRMEVVDVYYIGGFGVMGWTSAANYLSAQPDPLADSAAEIIQHMNADHADALVLLARAFAGIESDQAAMTWVDRLGFHVRLKNNGGSRRVRIPFLREVRTPLEARQVLIEMVRQAKQG